MLFLSNFDCTMKNRDAFIATMGESAYNLKIIDLLNKLPNPSVVNNPTGEITCSAVDVASSGGDDVMMLLNYSFNYCWCLS